MSIDNKENDDLYQIAVRCMIDTLRESAAFYRHANRQSHLSSLYESLVEIRAGVRRYYLTPEAVRMEIWPQLRKNSLVLDLVLEMTVDWSVRFTLRGMSLAKAHGAEPVSLLAKTMGYGHFDVCGRYPTQIKEQIVDTEFSEKLPTGSERYIDLFLKETWLVFTLLMTYNLMLVRNVISPPTVES